MPDLQIPDLNFAMVEYGKLEMPWDLRVLLYKGGSKANKREVFNLIAAGELGEPIVERIALVCRLHQAITARLVGGGRKASANSNVRFLRDFFAWADDGGHAITLENVEATFRQWCDFLLHRVHLRKISERTVSTKTHVVSSILDDALDRSQPLIGTTRVREPKRGVRAVGIAADKQNLAHTFAFGRLCIDVIDSLSLEAIRGPLPLMIQLGSGVLLEQWSKLQDPTKVACLKPGYKNKNNTENVLRQRAAWEADLSLRTRFPLVNLRLEAELLVFIAQTGMNTAQAFQLKRTQFSYKSTIDGYEVRDYKYRRQGQVLFEIFADYKIHFDRYLTWRDEMFAEESTDRLFPFVRQMGAAESTPPGFDQMKRKICKSAGIPFVSPRNLRKTRINWMLRQSRNPDLTAEQAQHTNETLLRVYEMPSLQVAQIEIIQFWKKSDPRLDANLSPCLAPGVCDGKPKAIPELPPGAPKPDCLSPAGCLFCDHHRDIDCEDYVWSMASMRHLNTVILKGYLPPVAGKIDSGSYVELTIDVLTAKLMWFEKSNAKRKAWVEEATERIAEGDFHPHWLYLIESAEGV